MKQLLKSTIVLIVMSGFIWVGCDQVDEGLVVTNVQDIPLNEDTVFVVDSIIITHKQVLLEDFTGHKCVNCPEAGVTAHEWAENYDHKLIIYAVHAGFQAFPDQTGEYTYDFTNPTGDEIFNFFNQPFNPTAAVNRVEYNGNTILLFVTGDWEAAVANEMAKPNVLDMKMQNKYFPNTNSVEVSVTSTAKDNLDGKYKIVVMVAEDLIVRPQKNNNEEVGPVPDWLDFHHRNVLRDAITSTFGQYVTADGSLVEGETNFNQFYYELDKPWISDTADYNIITYIYEEESLNILQTAELMIKKEE